jgi:hypothetical protein
MVLIRRQVRILEWQLHKRVRHPPVDRLILAGPSRPLLWARWPTFLVTPRHPGALAPGTLSAQADRGHHVAGATADA